MEITPPSSPPCTLPSLPSLRLKELTIGYRKGKKRYKVAEGISCEIEPGTIQVLLGFNGVGKSTLLKTVLGIIPPLEGKIYLGEKDLAKLSLKERSRYLSAYLPIYGNLDLYTFEVWEFSLKGVDPEREEEIRSLFSCTSFLHRPLRELSEGERQRVFLARTFLQGGSFFLLDEPFSYQDFSYKEELSRAIRTLVEKYRYGVLLTTHDMTVLPMGDTLLYLPPQGPLLTLPSHFRDDLSALKEFLRTNKKNSASGGSRTPTGCPTGS